MTVLAGAPTAGIVITSPEVGCRTAHAAQEVPQSYERASGGADTANCAVLRRHRSAGQRRWWRQAQQRAPRAGINRRKYVAESLEALLGQSFTDFELIISDNEGYSGRSVEVQANYS
jgi:hypothetical protein